MNTLYEHVIPRLVQAHPVGPGNRAEPALPPLDVAGFAKLLLAHDDAALWQQLNALQRAGAPHDWLLSALLAPVARRLGELWEDDRCHFVDVTIGLGRLQQIMRGLSSAYGLSVEPPADGRRILLMAAPGEQHTFGLAMVAEFFTRAGWDVASNTVADTADMQYRVQQEWFDLIGISAGTETRLPALRRCIQTVRQHSLNQAVAVMVGGQLFTQQPTLAAELGADGSASDGQQAPIMAEQLLAQRLRAG